MEDAAARASLLHRGSTMRMLLTGCRPLEVATCIACGARSRYAECPGGCDDVPIDLVEAEAVVPLKNALEQHRGRLAALRRLAESLAAEDQPAWPELRRQAREALRIDADRPAAPDTTIVEAWGCPSCGRIDAPQPCLGVCVRRPVAMVEARCLHDLTAQLAAAQADDTELTAVARLAAGVTPRRGQLDRTRAAVRARARIALETTAV